LEYTIIDTFEWTRKIKLGVSLLVNGITFLLSIYSLILNSSIEKIDENYLLNIGEQQYNLKAILINLIVMIWVLEGSLQGYN
jgi:hypothetical protein